MPTPYAREFTPELNKEYLASELNQIDTREASDEGRARAEGVAGGLGAQFATGAEIGAAREGAANRKSGVVNQFNMDVATKKYSERMTDEGQAFADTERTKTEDFQKSMAELGYNFESGQNDKALGAAKQGALIGGIFGLAGSAIKGYGASQGAAGD